MDWLDDLDAYAGEEYDEPVDDPTAPPPVLLDEDNVNRVLRGIARLRRDVVEVEQLARAEAARVDAWRADRTAGPLRRIGWLERSVEAWMRKVHAENPRLLTKKLPNGTVQLRARQVKAWTGDEVPFDTLESIDDRFVARTPRVDARALVAATVPGDVLDFFPEGHDGFELRSAVVVVYPFPFPWSLVALPVVELPPSVGLLVPTERSFSISVPKSKGEPVLEPEAP